VELVSQHSLRTKDTLNFGTKIDRATELGVGESAQLPPKSFLPFL